MKKTATIVSILVLSFLFVGAVFFGSQPAYAKAKLLRLIVPTPPGDFPLTFSCDELAKRFNARAKGEYIIEVHAGGALAKLPEYFNAVRVGAVEMAFSPWAMFSFMDPQLGIIEIPFMFVSMPAVASACKPLLPLYDQILQKKFNAKGLSMMNIGGIQLFSTKPVKTLEDWKGLLTGAMSPPGAAMIKELGGSPVTVMFPDMYESLQKKVIDATIFTSHGGVIFGFSDVCKNVTMFMGISGFYGFSINLDVWKKMPKHIQQILKEEATAAKEFVSASHTKLGEDDMKYYEKKGVEVYFVPREERERWEKAIAPYKSKQLARFGELGQKIKKIVDEANKSHPYTKEGMLY